MTDSKILIPIYELERAVVEEAMKWRDELARENLYCRTDLPLMNAVDALVQGKKDNTRLYDSDPMTVFYRS